MRTGGSQVSMDFRRPLQSWTLMGNLASLSTLPWCMIGDFNDILSQYEKRAGMDDTRPNSVEEQLERAMASSVWNNRFVKASLTNMIASH